MVHQLLEHLLLEVLQDNWGAQCCAPALLERGWARGQEKLHTCLRRLQGGKFWGQRNDEL